MEYEILRPDDMHIHLRQDDLLARCAPHAASIFGRAIVMPNTIPPITTPTGLERYREEILGATRGTGFAPLMTFKIAEHLTPDDVAALAAAGAVAGKYYPRGATTNSADGIGDHRAVYPVLHAMERNGLVLCIHGEDPNAFSLDREQAFLPVLSEIVGRFPTLRVVLEHVSSGAAIELVASMPARVAATITVHHIFLTLDDVVGELLHPHHFCKPVAKRPEDRDAVRAAVLSGDPRFFFGSDSAPHEKRAKECADGCAGVYTAPVAMPLLAELFESEFVSDSADGRDSDTAHHRPDWVTRLEDFTARFGARFYGIPLPTDRVLLKKNSWMIPAQIDGIVPFRAGTHVSWSVSA